MFRNGLEGGGSRPVRSVRRKRALLRERAPVIRLDPQMVFPVELETTATPECYNFTVKIYVDGKCVFSLYLTLDILRGLSKYDPLRGAYTSPSLGTE